MKQAMYPSLLNRAWKDRVLELASNVLIIPLTRAQPATANLISVMETSVNADADANQDEMRFKRSVKDLYVRPVHVHIGLQVPRLISYSADDMHLLVGTAEMVTFLSERVPVHLLKQ
jgi:hypothetical protein